MQLPAGYKACISARSVLANKGLIVTNAPGQIDSDYRGRVKVVVTNVGKEIVVIEHGDRFAQMWVEPVYLFEWVYASVLDSSDRGAGGFGSTGD
jgi:dUTP pyrophosphatase